MRYNLLFMKKYDDFMKEQSLQSRLHVRACVFPSRTNNYLLGILDVTLLVMLDVRKCRWIVLVSSSNYCINLPASSYIGTRATL